LFFRPLTKVDSISGETKLYNPDPERYATNHLEFGRYVVFRDSNGEESPYFDKIGVFNVETSGPTIKHCCVDDRSSRVEWKINPGKATVQEFTPGRYVIGGTVCDWE